MRSVLLQSRILKWLQVLSFVVNIFDWTWRTTTDEARHRSKLAARSQNLYKDSVHRYSPHKALYVNVCITCIIMLLSYIFLNAKVSYRKVIHLLLLELLSLIKRFKDQHPITKKA